MAVPRTDYITVAVSTTAVCESSTGSGKAGDILARVHVVPLTASPGNVDIKDGSGAAQRIFTGGAASGLLPVLDSRPFTVELNARSKLGAWSVITTANIEAIPVGRFS